MGGKIQMGKLLQVAACGAVLVALAACDENGEFGFPSAQQAEQDAPFVPANSPNQVMTERDVERPDIFSIIDRGLWDGRPSLGGAWVAHPDVLDPERVVIRNTENGREIIGALFRRERDNPGPLLQVSSDAAEVLGLLPGAPTPMSVVVLRREEIEVVATAEADVNPVVGSLAAPVTVAQTPLDVASEAEASDDVAVVLPAATAAVIATEAVAQTALAAADVVADTAGATAETAQGAIDVSGILAPVAPLPAGTFAQIGVFSVQPNADTAAAQATQAGFAAQVVPIESGGRTVWQVTVGPLVPDTGVAELKALGFIDAVVISETE